MKYTSSFRDISTYVLCFSWIYRLLRNYINHSWIRVVTSIYITLVLYICVFYINIYMGPTNPPPEILGIDMLSLKIDEYYKKQKKDLQYNEMVDSIKSLVELFGANNVYILGYFDSSYEWNLKYLLEELKFFKNTGVMRKNIIFQRYYNSNIKLSKSKETIIKQCKNLGITYYVSNRVSDIDILEDMVQNIFTLHDGAINNESYCSESNRWDNIKLQILNRYDYINNRKTKWINNKRINNDKYQYYPFTHEPKFPGKLLYAIYIGNTVKSTKNKYAFSIMLKEDYNNWLENGTISEIGYITKSGEIISYKE